MTINYTTLLGLTEPVTGTQSGTWGSDINTGLTDYVEAAIAGAQVISGSQTAVTLSVTTGSSSAPTTLSQAGSGATGSSQYQIIRCTGNPAGLLTITAPASDKTYVVINATSTSQSVKIVGTGPTTGVTIVSGERAFVAWNGSDFVKVGGAAGGTNTQVQYNNNGVFGGVSGATTNGTAITFSTTNLKLQGSSTGVSSFASANSSATDYTVTFPAASTTIPVATQTLTFSGPTAARTITLPDANFTAARTDSAQTFTGVQTFSSDASVNGLTVGRGGGAVATNTAVGYQAGYSNTTGTRNLFQGYQAAYYNTTGNDNTALGYGAYGWNTGAVNATGSSNTAVGSQALAANTTASNNTAVGYQAGYSNTTGSGNTFTGQQAGYGNTTGDYNVIYGRQAFYTNTTGTENTVSGYAALYANTTGNYNVAIGSTALRFNTTASNNTAVGYQAGYSNTTAGDSTFVGRLAGYGATGQFNTAIGSRTLETSGSGTDNTALGYGAGNSLTTGSFNTFLGRNAGASVSTGSKNTIVGYYNGNQGSLDIRTANNYIVLSDGDGNPRQIIDSSGNLGLGVTPSAWNTGAGPALQVNYASVSQAGGFDVTNFATNAFLVSGVGYKYIGSASATMYQQNAGGHRFFTAPSGTANTAITSFTQAMTLDASGNLLVGATAVGTYGPNGLLISKANVAAGTSGKNLAVFTSNAQAADIGGSISLGGIYESGGTQYEFASIKGAKENSTNANAAGYLAFQTTSSANTPTERARITSGGGFFIGNGETAASPSAGILSATGGTGTDIAGANLTIRGGASTGTGAGGVIIFSTAAASGTSGTATNSASERARITSGGYFCSTATGTLFGTTSYNFSWSDAQRFYLYHASATAANAYGIELRYNSTPNGTGNEFLYCTDTNGGTLRASVRSNGGLANYSANNVNLSDRREKTNFAPAKSYLDTICAIPVQTFNYIDQSEDDPGLTLGVVAQDVQAVAPELVMESNWGTEENPKMRLSIYQTDLQYALMKCIQEQQAIITSLTARVAALEGTQP